MAAAWRQAAVPTSSRELLREDDSTAEVAPSDSVSNIQAELLDVLLSRGAELDILHFSEQVLCLESPGGFHWVDDECEVGFCYWDIWFTRHLGSYM